MIKTEPKAQWRRSKTTFLSLLCVSTIFISIILIFLVVSSLLKSKVSYTAELVLFLGMILNVFGTLLLSHIGELYLNFSRTRMIDSHRHVERQGESFYPDLPAKTRFKARLFSVILQVIYLIALNVIIFAIAKSKSTYRAVFWLWMLGCVFGGCSVMMDIAAVIRLYIAEIMYSHDRINRVVHGNLELLGAQAASGGIYEEESLTGGSNHQFTLGVDEEPF